MLLGVTVGCTGIIGAPGAGPLVENGSGAGLGGGAGEGNSAALGGASGGRRGSAGNSGAVGGTAGGATAGDVDGGGSAVGAVLNVSGRHLQDTCGNPLVIRGIESTFGAGFEVNGSLANVVDEIAKTGANAIRILPNITQLGVSDIDPIFARAVQNGLVFFVSPGDETWFGRNDVQALIQKYEPWVIIDAFQEPNYDDPVRWLSEAKAAVALIRSYGYRVPITVLSNQYGRDLPTALAHGGEVVATDPRANTIIGWQAYWGSSNTYQKAYGMTLHQGIQNASAAAFPIQAGIEKVTDGTTETMDYGTAMTDAQSMGIGWLWWDWRLLVTDGNTLSSDGTAAHLTSLGTDVVTSQAASLAKTAQKACRPPGS
jgi:mannan endo-1,4-beta-mannosidase